MASWHDPPSERVDVFSRRVELLSRIPSRGELPWRQLQAAYERLTAARAEHGAAARAFEAAAAAVRELGVSVSLDTFADLGDPPIGPPE